MTWLGLEENCYMFVSQTDFENGCITLTFTIIGVFEAKDIVAYLLRNEVIAPDVTVII